MNSKINPPTTLFPKRYPRRGDIWMVDLRYNIGSEQNGVRPCLVLNKPAKRERTCIIVPSSSTKRKYSYEIQNYIFLIHQIRVVDTTRFTRKISRFSEKDTNKVYKKVLNFLS